MDDRELGYQLGKEVIQGRDVSSIVFVQMAQTEQLDDVTIAEHAGILNPWVVDVDYAAKTLVQYDGVAYRCVQAHKSAVDWTPDKTASLWKSLVGFGDEYPPWSQPLGAHDAYMKGDKVTYNGKRYVSQIDNNTYSPSAYPAGWKEVA